MSTARRWLLGLQTLAGRRRGWFLPYRYADSLPSAGEAGPYTALSQQFAAAEPAFQDVLDRAATYRADFARFGGAPPAPRFEQDWFPSLDAVAAYVLLRERRPARIVEVGSGHSTRVMMRAIADGGFACAVTAIDPAPRADLSGLDLSLIRTTVHQAGLAPFAALSAGDLLFIDSSHLMMPGSDVDLLLNQILPSLPAGVLVHIHDIFLPDDYPTHWTWRGYNEQQAVACLLQGNWRIVWASAYVTSRMAPALARSVLAELPRSTGGFQSSLWLIQ